MFLGLVPFLLSSMRTFAALFKKPPGTLPWGCCRESMVRSLHWSAKQRCLATGPLWPQHA